MKQDMQKDRMLAYKISHKLSEEEIQDAVSGSGQVTQLGPSGGTGQPWRLDFMWDM